MVYFLLVLFYVSNQLITWSFSVVTTEETCGGTSRRGCVCVYVCVCWLGGFIYLKVYSIKMNDLHFFIKSISSVSQSCLMDQHAGKKRCTWERIRDERIERVCLLFGLLFCFYVLRGAAERRLQKPSITCTHRTSRKYKRWWRSKGNLESDLILWQWTTNPRQPERWQRSWSEQNRVLLQPPGLCCWWFDKLPQKWVFDKYKSCWENLFWWRFHFLPLLDWQFDAPPTSTTTSPQSPAPLRSSQKQSRALKTLTE